MGSGVRKSTGDLFVDRKALKVVKLPKGARALGTTTRLDYKINKSQHVHTTGPEWILILPTSIRRKRDYWQQSQRNMVARH